MEDYYYYVNKKVNIPAIAESGQCFRMDKHERLDGTVYYDVLSTDKFVRIEDTFDRYLFVGRKDDVLYWVDYFDLQADYRKYNDVIEASDDEFLHRAFEFSKGIRILRQDFWETLVSFIISQNNNIPRIKHSIELFCKRFGKKLEYKDSTFYTFPTQDSLLGVELSDLQGLGLGYRDKYVLNACRCDPELFFEPDESKLLSLQGVGPKVANCVLLYGAHQIDRYPKDTWINRMISDVYSGNFDTSPYAGFEGYVQLIQFYYYRKMKGSRS